MEGTAYEYFGAQADGYDSLIRRCVPRYDEMIDRLVTYLPDGPVRIVELGCGTGNLTLRLLERYPSARLTIVDASPEMIELARRRAGDDADRLEPMCASFEEVALEDAAFELVTSTISLHHVAEKGPLYERVARALAPGGHLIFSDQLRGGDERLHGINWQHWLAFCRSGDPCTEEEIQDLLEHADAHDHYTPLAEHLRLLDDAGFVDLDCTWRNWIWGIVVGRRPPS